MTNTKALEEQVRQEIASGVHALAAAMVEDIAVPTNALVSKQQQIQKIEEQFISDLDAMKKVCHEGLSYCIGALQELASLDSSIDMAAFKSHLIDSFDRIDSAETVAKLGAELLQGKTWKELLQISNSAIEMLYRGAKSHFDAKSYDKAESAFSFLVVIDPSHYQFWLGLGHSAFNLHHKEKAINAYAMASMVDPVSPWPHIHAANCFEANSDYPHALIALEMAQETNGNSPQKDHALAVDLSQRINLLRHKA